MKKFKTEKGITLVALIITIVVLLILAAVAIGAVQDSNLIAHAQNAAGGYNQAKTNEITELQRVEEYINSIIPNKGEDQVITKEYVRETSKLIYTITGEKHEVTVLFNDQVMLGPTEIVLVTSLAEYGYTINNDSGDNNLWYVLSKEDNTVMGFAFSADKTKIYQGEADNGNKVLNISSYYME